jgi:acetylornithine deacetylase/succinyl-diaminopimelate desuccinylase-like protein
LTNGLLDSAIECVDKNIKALDIKGLERHIIKIEGKPPMILYVIESDDPAAKNTLLYGHLDKQPWMAGWNEGLSPTDPVIRGDFMYGRGASDDGYASFAVLMAIKICQI